MIRSLVCQVVLTTCLAGTGLGATAVMAQDRTPNRVAVTFANADFKDEAQVEQVYRKLYKAAQYVCESEGAGPKWREDDDRACERQAVDDAVTDLHRPQLSRLHLRLDADPDRIARAMPTQENSR